MGVTFIAPEGTYTAPAKLITKEITENNTYNASDDNANGYSSVTVNVGGGGGSSDFSTAEVTFICDGPEGAYYSVGNIAYINNGILRASGYRTFPQPSADLRVDKGTNVTLDMILYKNILPYDVFAHYDDSTMPIITGNVEMTEQGLLITGSCSIQLTGYSAS